MINISINTLTLPTGVTNSAFTLDLGGGYTPHLGMHSGDPLKNASAWTPSLRVGETLSVDDATFQTLVSNYGQGASNETFIPRIVYLVNRGVLKVQQDGGAALTAKQIIAYTAP